MAVNKKYFTRDHVRMDNWTKEGADVAHFNIVHQSTKQNKKQKIAKGKRAKYIYCIARNIP